MTARVTLTAKEAAALGLAPPRRSKYGARKVVIDGVTFDSAKEARRYGELKVLEAAGEITDLVLQPSFDLLVLGGAKVGTYRADFGYVDCHTKERVTEDCKGMRTSIYKLKKKIVEAVYNIMILET